MHWQSVYVSKTMVDPTLYPYLLEAIARDNVLPLTSVCNLGCIFCSHRQNPTEVNTFRLPPLEVETVLELAQFLDPQQKVIIGESATRLDEGEPFTHPHILTILGELRKLFPHNTFALTTNGTLLTEETVVRLQELAPVELTLSLNSVTAAGRESLLRDKKPERVMQAVQALHRHGIPFHGSLVAMPHVTGWADVDETVDFLASNKAQTIRVFLPGYTKLAPAELRFPLSQWPQIINWAQQKTAELGIPIIAEPATSGDLVPKLYGIIANSPAAEAGLQCGDIIVKVDDKPVRTRVEAYQLARRGANPTLVVVRGGGQFTVQLAKKSGQAPGFVVHYDFAPERLAAIAAEISRHRSTAPLLLASEFAATMLGEVARFLDLPTDCVHVTKNHYFGGSIRSAGLLTVEDLFTAAKSVLANRSFDLLLVPREAFDHRGEDLRGVNISELSAALVLPVSAV